MSSRQTRQQREEEEEEEAARLGGPVSRADFEVLETAAFENAAAAAAAIAAGEQAQEAAAAARESAEEQAAALQAQIAGLSGQIAALVTAASSGGGVVAASAAAAPEPQSAAECRMPQPSAQLADSWPLQPAAQPATSLRTERATRATECAVPLFEHTSVRPRRSALTTSGSPSNMLGLVMSACLCLGRGLFKKGGTGT
jgi:hypothetical protein